MFMTRVACQYAIVRFAPFVETGEFANVGILMMAPKDRFFGFQLETRRFARITRFFRELDRKHYLKAVQNVQAELERVHDVLKAHGFDRRRKFNDVEFAQRLFAEVIRPRESTIRFGEPRVTLAENPAQKLKELFAYYVERNFVTKQYSETLLEKNVRRWLVDAHVADRFQPETVGDEAFPIKFPFVELRDSTPFKIIKPLNLAQAEPRQIIERGGFWAFRLRELRRRHRLPERVLFTVAGPDSPNEARKSAFNDAIQRLEDANVEVVGARERKSIVQFARQQPAA